MRGSIVIAYATNITVAEMWSLSAQDASNTGVLSVVRPNVSNSSHTAAKNNNKPKKMYWNKIFDPECSRA